MLYPIRYLSLCSLLWLPSIQAAWLPTENIPLSSSGGVAVVAVDPAGNATAVWMEPTDFGAVQASTKSVGEGWTNPVKLQDTADKLPYGLDVAVDSEGNVTAAWIWSPNPGLPGKEVFASTKPFNQPWQTIPTILSSQTNNVDSRMAIAPNGTATVVWGHSESGLDTIQAKTRRAGQDWPTDPDTISPPGQQASSPDVAVDNLGNVTAVWKTVDGGTGITTIQTSTKQPEGSWPSTSDTLSTSIPPGSSVVGPYIAVNLSGNSAAVWSVNDGTTTTLYASTRGLPSEPWPTTPDTLFSTDTNMAPQVAIDLSGNTTVIWGGSFPFDNTAVQALTKPFGGAWPTIPEPISSAGIKARFTIDPLGNATAVWYSNTDPIEVRASTKLFGSTWQPTADILSTGIPLTSPPDIATDMFGNVTALWPNIGTAVQSAT